jgi:phage host-nuclease inhibitor protein Gam
MNKTIPLPAATPAPTITSRHELDAVVENIVQLQLNRAELEREQEQEIAGVRQKFRAPLAEIERYLTLESAWVETWARSHPDTFRDRQSLALTHAVIGFRISPHRVDRASRKWTWGVIAQKLGELAWGRRYLRQPALEVNKEALLADRVELSPAELRTVGLKIVQEERFFISPHRETEAIASDENEWLEAA